MTPTHELHYLLMAVEDPDNAIRCINKVFVNLLAGAIHYLDDRKWNALLERWEKAFNHKLPTFKMRMGAINYLETFIP
jgi:hypothetical protein